MVVENWHCKIRYSGWIAALLRKSIWNREIETPSWIPPLLLWKRDFRPRHFRPAAAGLYRYAERSGELAARGSKAFWRAYFGQKLRQKRHAKPLVWSGQTEAESARGVVHATSRGAKYKMSLTKARYRPGRPAKYKTGPAPDMAAEMTRATHREVGAMLRAKERDMIRRIRDIRAAFDTTAAAGGQ